MAPDVLARAEWSCCRTAPGAAGHPGELEALSPRWYAAAVPGTAAGALRAAAEPHWMEEDLDATDWWWRTRFSLPAGTTGPMRLLIGGIATAAEVFVNGMAVLHTQNMFRSSSCTLDALGPDNEIAIRCHALTPLLGTRRPRPRWRTRLVANQNLRWFRTTLLGRMPGWAASGAPVGPWRPVRLLDDSRPRLGGHRITASCVGRDGHVELEVHLEGTLPGMPFVGCEVGTTMGELARDPLDPARFSGVVVVPDVERWWPCTHGPQPLYPVTVRIQEETLTLPAVGFRSIALDRRSGRFALVVNGTEVFCRGATWVPLDAITLQSSREELRQALELVRLANLNMVRVTGTMVYEEDTFFDLCDELGILVWQDCMFANLDPPEDAGFEQEVRAELTEVLSTLSGRPCLAVVSGGSEIEQQAAMTGAPPGTWTPRLMGELVPALLDALVPGVVYLPSSPTGGALPFHCDEGVAHYFGVGAYLRPLDDARRADVRFAAECLAFSIPPETETIDAVFGGAFPAGHDPRWKRAVPRDAGASWDFEDVTSRYVRDIFGKDQLALRYGDPERALDLARAAVCECMRAVFSEWRRPGSACAGGLVLSLRDLLPGAGWGLVDALGRPKAPWYVLRRVLAPIALNGTDEGLNGLRLQVLNDTAAPLCGTLRLELWSGTSQVECAEHPIEVAARSGAEIGIDGLLGAFRDVNYAYRFGPPGHDALVATLLGASEELLAEYVHSPRMPASAPEHDVGLHATLQEGVHGSWELELSSTRLAQFVALDVPGYLPEDCWFHLAPGRIKTVLLAPMGAHSAPAGRIRALNSRVLAPFSAHVTSVGARR